MGRLDVGVECGRIIHDGYVLMRSVVQPFRGHFSIAHVLPGLYKACRQAGSVFFYRQEIPNNTFCTHPYLSQVPPRYELSLKRSQKMVQRATLSAQRTEIFLTKLKYSILSIYT